MTRRFCVTLVGLLFAVAAGAQQRPTGSSAAIQKAFMDYVRQMDGEAVDQGPQLKAVPRTDKAEATIVGIVDFVESTDFLDDGTPFRGVWVFTKRPFEQFVLVFCVGSSFNSSCGRLIEGRRASFTVDVLGIEDGDSAGLALLVAKRLQT